MQVVLISSLVKEGAAMRDRELPCLHYQYEGCCDLGKAGTFRDQCQICSSYRKKPGANAARTDNRRKKLDRINRKEKWD